MSKRQVKPGENILGWNQRFETSTTLDISGNAELINGHFTTNFPS
jgi:hypothetical protein